MKLFDKKKTTIQQDFPNWKTQISLEALDWQYRQFNDKPFQMVKMSEIENESLMFASFLDTLPSRIKYGDYVYQIYPNRVERTSPKIKLRTKSNPLVKLSSKLKLRIKKKTKDRGLVYKVE